MIRQALETCAKALAFSYGGTRPEDYTDAEDIAGCRAMHAAYEALAAIGRPGSGPDDGHEWTFSVTSRMSSSVVGDPHHADADWVGPSWLLTVRAWSLAEACERAAAAGLPAWSIPHHSLSTPPDAVLRRVAGRLQGSWLKLHR